MLAYSGVLLFCLAFCVSGVPEKPVSYAGHKVLSVTPKGTDELDMLRKLRSDYGVDLWNEPRYANQSVMMRLHPNIADSVISYFNRNHVVHFTAFEDLERVIKKEKIQNAPAFHNTSGAIFFDFGRYHQLEEVTSFIQQVANTYTSITKLEVAGKSYEHRPIYNLKISGNGQFGTKPVVFIECGIHAREWSSVAAGVYLVNELVTKFGHDTEVTELLTKYEFNIVAEANPDGYLYTWQVDRLWRKTRSHSKLDWLGNCRGTDANRNYDINHCGIGTSRKPCDDTYCGDAPFSESETRTVRDIMNEHGSNVKAYISLHAFSQYWMTPYGYTKQLPPDYTEHVKVGSAGVKAIARRYGTEYQLGSIANIIYEASSSSVDYAYVVKKIKMSFALELRDRGRFGFFLPQPLILPMCEETYDGLIAAIETL